MNILEGIPVGGGVNADSKHAEVTVPSLVDWEMA